MATLNVNTNELVKHTLRLEKINKIALPTAVRGSLNDAVYDVKTKTMPASAKDAFINRTPNFFKADSKYEPAKGLTLKQMKATVGFVSTGLKGSDNYAVKDLEQQEYGGAIPHKTLIPMNSARAGGSKTKLVRANARLSQIRNAVNSNKFSGKSKKEKFIKAIIAAGQGGYVIGANKMGENILYKVNSYAHSHIKSRSLKINLTPLYDIEKGRSVRVRSTHFMRKASLLTAKKLDDFYIKRATAQVKKYYKR